MRSPNRAPLNAPLQENTRAAELASALRERPEELDQVTRARMERSLVQAWRTRAAANVVLPQTQPGRSRSARSSWPGRSIGWPASLAIAAAAGAVVAYFGGNIAVPSAFRGANGNVAQFELRIGESAVQRGAIAEGQVLESGELGDIEIDLGSADIAMARGARVRFDRLTPNELRVSLATGRIDVHFHPAHTGEQQLVIESRAAVVRVVGTRFTVDADAVGNTEVTVREGVVEVTPHSDGVTQRVSAGERTYVRADEGDAYERAVRAAIEQQIETLDPLAPEATSAEAALAPIAVAEPVVADADEDAASGKLSSDVSARRLQHARSLLREGRHPAARTRLRSVSERSAELRYRVEALTLLAESFTSQGDVRRATESYEQASKLGARTPQGDNAQFALARLLERFTRDRAAATRAYERYLERAPNGALAAQARTALCRLQGGNGCK